MTCLVKHLQQQTVLLQIRLKILCKEIVVEVMYMNEKYDIGNITIRFDVMLAIKKTIDVNLYSYIENIIIYLISIIS